MSVVNIAASAQDPCAVHFNSKAYQCIRRGEWQQGLYLYERFWQAGGILDAHAYLDLAKARLRLGDTVTAVTHLAEAVECGATWDGKDGSVSIMQVLEFDAPEWLAAIFTDYDRYHSMYLNRLDTSLINNINAMVERDQQVRLYDQKTLSEDGFRRRLRTTDSLHMEEVKRIFDRYGGFPPDSILTRRSKFGLTLMIQHFIRGFPDTFEYFAEIVREAIGRYQLHPSEYAVMVDRCQYMIDGKTIYGEVPYRNDAGVSSVDNIKNIDEVDSLRYSIGLGSLRQHSNDRGSALPGVCGKEHNMPVNAMQSVPSSHANNFPLLWKWKECEAGLGTFRFHRSRKSIILLGPLPSIP